jgi:hypothetical protein
MNIGVSSRLLLTVSLARALVLKKRALFLPLGWRAYSSSIPPNEAVVSCR